MRIPAHSVCTAIRDDIVAGVHERGGRLTEELLARRYGVSRVPVREALRTLEAEGFVVTRRHAGACVAEPTEQEAADLLEMRRLLEPSAPPGRPSGAPTPISRCCAAWSDWDRNAHVRATARICARWADGSTRRSPRPPAARR